MTTYITEAQFVGMLLLDFNNYSGFDDYAAQIQEKMLLSLLGYEQYKDLEDDDTTDKWVALLDGVEYTDSDVLIRVAGIKAMLPYFFYFYYSRDIQSFNSTLGEFESLAENATGSARARLNSKIINSYNKGVDLYNQIANYMAFAEDNNPPTYDYGNYITQTLTKLNVWGI